MAFKILHLEDNFADAELINIVLQDTYPLMAYTHVSTKEKFINALKNNAYHIILSDYNVPGVLEKEALEWALQYQPNTPVIYVSGAISTEKAIAILHSGGTDYVMKKDVEKLPITINRALKEKQIKLDKEKAESDLIKLNIAIDNSINEVYIFDAINLKFSYANNSALKNLDYTLKALKTMSPIDIKPEFTYDSFTKMLLPLNNGIVNKLQFETLHQRKDKTTYPVEVNLTQFTNDNKLQYLALIIDLTQRKKEEENRLKAVEITNHFLQESQSIALLGYYTYDFKTKNWSASKSISNLMGLKTGKGKLKDWLNIIYPEDKHILTKTLNKRLTDDTVPLDVTYRIQTPKDGKLHWIHHKGKPIKRDEKGELLPALGVIQDITVQKLAEEKLKNSELKLKEAQKITGLGVLEFEFKKVFFESSPIFDRIAGLEKNYTKDFKGWIQLIHNDDLEKLQKLAADISIINIPSIEFRMIRQTDKKIIWVNASGKKNYDNNGLFTKFTGTIQDITERKKQEAEIQQSHTILNQIESLIQVSDEKGNITYTSPSVKTLLGYEPQEILGQSWWQKITSSLEEANKVRDAVLNNILHNTAVPDEIIDRKIKAKDGTYKTFQWLSSRSVDNAIIFVGIDITEKLYEQQLKEIIYNITKKASETLNLDTLFSFIKTELSKLINTDNFFIALYDEKTQMIQLPYIVDKHDDYEDFPKSNSLTGYVIDTQKPLLSIASVERKKKLKSYGHDSKCWLGVPLIVNKKSIGAIAVQSYTDKKAYTQKDVNILELVATNISQIIKQSQDFEKINLLNQALIQSPEIVFVTDLNGIIEYINPAFTNISGYSEKEALGQTPRILKSGKQSSNEYKSLWKTLIKGKTWRGEIINKRKDGSEFLVEANMSPVKNKDGVITHFLGIEEDITEKRKLERDFIHAFIDAQEREKHNFGEELHDGISQILSAQAMYIDVLIRLNKDSLDDKTKFLHNVKELNTNAIDDVRAIAHGLMSKQLSEKGLLLAVAHICTDYNQSKNVKFKCVYTGLTEEEISKDIKTQLFRVVQEISTNIIRHSGATNAEICLSKTKKNQLKLIVKDNGVGIDLVKIKEENSGAGLKNIEQRITLLNGKVNLDSELGRGTTYTILVPLN